MAKSSPVQKLRNLNSLLTAMNPCGRETADEIRKAVDFFIDEVQAANPKSCSFPEFAQEILKIHIRSNNGVGLAFWSVNPAEVEPLWLRSIFMNKLEELAQYKIATLVVFGLQDTVAEDTKYWTQKLESKYNEIRENLESIAAEVQNKGCILNLIYV